MIRRENAPEELKNMVMSLLGEGFESLEDIIKFKIEHNDRRDSYDNIVTYEDPIMEGFTDAKVVCGISLDNVLENGSAYVAITDQMLDMWKVTADDVIYACKENLRNEDFELKTLYGLLVDMLPDADEYMEEKGKHEDIYVLSNHSKLNGSRMILDEDNMEMLKKKFGKFYILPSSIHEVLIIPESAGMSLENLEEMVASVNDTQVEEQDLFSYKVVLVG